jgi:hypothetical protein
VVVPTRHYRRADPANSIDDASGSHEEDEVEPKHASEFQAAEAPRRIAGASALSICDEVLDRSHPPIVSLREDEDFAPETKVEARDGGLHSLDEHDCLWLFVPDIAPQAHSVDNPSERRRRLWCPTMSSQKHASF